MLEARVGCSDLSCCDGAGDIDSELALLADDVTTSASVLGRLVHSR
jgi:hypothetical protein